MSDTDIDTLLDATLDDLADLPSFKPFSAGAHECKLTLEKKDINSHPTVEATLVLVTTVEYATPTDAEENPNKTGDTCNSAYFLDNDIGQGKFKTLAAVLGAALGTANLGEIVEQTNDMDVMVITGVRADKNDKDKFYLDIKEVQVV